MFTWSEPKIIKTKWGLRRRSTCPVSEERMAYYRANKDRLRAEGVTMSEWPKGSGKWEFVRWEKIEEDFDQESRSTEVPTEYPAPEGRAYRPFQKAGIAFILRHKKVLLGDDMGLGKTVQVIGVINADPTIQKVLIVCPKSLVLNWRTELERWLVRPLSVTLNDLAGQICIVPYSQVGKLPLLDCSWDLVAADESHYCKNPKAQRTKTVFAVRGRYQVAMTGTPIPNRTIEAFTTLNWLHPNRFPKFFPFAKRYANAMKTSWGWDFSGSSNLDELQATLRDGIMIRRLKGDVLKELPPKVRSVVVLAADEDAIREEAEIAQKLPYNEGLERIKAVSAHFDELSAVRHRTALAKCPAAIEYLEEKLESFEGKLVVFAHHRDVIDRISDGLARFGVVRITGEDSGEDRQNAVTAFQGDPSVRVIVCSILAAGVGLTLTAASTVCFVELDWVPGNVTQAEDRCHRIGQLDTVSVEHLMMDGTIDRRMADLVIAKQNVLDRALDRPVELNREEPPKPKPTGIFAGGLPSRNPGFPSQDTGFPSNGGAFPSRVEPATNYNEQGLLAALRHLAAQCDGAHKIDGTGFNKLDARFGKELAQRDRLSPRQAECATRLCRKYRKQLSLAGVSWEPA